MSPSVTKMRHVHLESWVFGGFLFVCFLGGGGSWIFKNLVNSWEFRFMTNVLDDKKHTCWPLWLYTCSHRTPRDFGSTWQPWSITCPGSQGRTGAIFSSTRTSHTCFTVSWFPCLSSQWKKWKQREGYVFSLQVSAWNARLYLHLGAQVSLLWM